MSPVRRYHLRRCTSALSSLLHRDNTEVEYTGRRHHTIFVKISDLHCRYARFLLLGWLVDQQQPSRMSDQRHCQENFSMLIFSLGKPEITHHIFYLAAHMDTKTGLVFCDDSSSSYCTLGVYSLMRFIL